MQILNITTKTQRIKQKQVTIICFKRLHRTLSSQRPRYPCQIKDILKGALRFNQSQLEAEENEELTIADDHYTSTATAMETALGRPTHTQELQDGGGVIGRSHHSNLDSALSAEEEQGHEVEQQAVTPQPQQQVDLISLLACSLRMEDYYFSLYIYLFVLSI